MSAPAFAVVPDRDGFRVFDVPADQYKFAYRVVPPFDWRTTAAYCEIETVVLDVQMYAKAERIDWRERRRLARANGRRNARPVPVETRWEVRVAAHPDVPQHEVRRLIEERATVVDRLWYRWPHRSARP
jgi:hypothetical protein